MSDEIICIVCDNLCVSDVGFNLRKCYNTRKNRAICAECVLTAYSELFQYSNK